MYETLTFPVRFVILYPFLLALLVTLAVSPGLLVGGWLARIHNLRTLYVVPVAVLTASLVGYVAFWIWFASPVAGAWFSAAVVAAELAAAVRVLATASGRALLRHLDVAVPLALLVLVALFYNGAVSTCLDTNEVACVFGGPSWDNALPQYFASNVAHGEPRLRVGDWLGSDRPPLQSGVVLAHSLFTQAAPFANVAYQLLGSALQCLWVVALWVAARRMRVPVARIAVMVAMCVCCGFFFFNSVYVWPKLLAASFGLVGFCLVVAEPRRVLHWGLAGAFFAAAMLSHNGVFFALAPIGAVLLFVRRYRPSPRMAAAGIGVAAALLGPWLAYQHFYDPPGNRLVRWHLAGVIVIDDRSFGQAMRDSYSGTLAGELLQARVDNVQMALGAFAPAPHIAGTSTFAALRGYEIVATALGIGLLNLGWLGLLVPALRRRWATSDVDRRLVRLSVAVGLGGLVGWLLALFLPNDATIAQGSYLTMMLLMIGFGAMLAAWPGRALAVLVSIQFGYFGLVWIVSFTLEDGHSVSRKAIVWMLLGLGGLAWCLRRLIRHRDPVLPATVATCP